MLRISSQAKTIELLSKLCKPRIISTNNGDKADITSVTMLIELYRIAECTFECALAVHHCQEAKYIKSHSAHGWHLQTSCLMKLILYKETVHRHTITVHRASAISISSECDRQCNQASPVHTIMVHRAGAKSASPIHTSTVHY